jgi:putative membrane protein
VIDVSWLLAHGGARHLETHEVLGWWSLEPWILALLMSAAAIYATGVARVWRNVGGGRGIRAWEAACFALGWLSIVIALVSPLDRLGAVLFSAHMAQHEVLMIVAAPLVVLGRPFVALMWFLRAPARASFGRLTHRTGVKATWRALTGPFVVLLIHAAILWVWHVPALFEGAMRHPAVHAVQHATFFWSAALFWWSLLQGRYGRMGYGIAVAYVFATALHTSILGALLTVAGSVWYPIYGERGAPFAVSVLEDQQLAGLIMWVPAGVIFTVVALALFAAWMGESERRVRLTLGEALGQPEAPRA